jgi:hypothetical protein
MTSVYGFLFVVIVTFVLYQNLLTVFIKNKPMEPVKKIEDSIEIPVFSIVLVVFFSYNQSDLRGTLKIKRVHLGNRNGPNLTTFIQNASFDRENGITYLANEIKRMKA